MAPDGARGVRSSAIASGALSARRQRAGRRSRLRVIARLVGRASGTMLWPDVYDIDPNAPGAITLEQDIASRVATAVGPSLRRRCSGSRERRRAPRSRRLGYGSLTATCAHCGSIILRCTKPSTHGKVGLGSQRNWGRGIPRVDVLRPALRPPEAPCGTGNLYPVRPAIDVDARAMPEPVLRSLGIGGERMQSSALLVHDDEREAAGRA